MTKQDDKEQFEILNNIYVRCSTSDVLSEEEMILRYYTECLMKLHKAYLKICETEMLTYVRQIVAPAFPLVIRYFDREVRQLYQNGRGQHEILSDIETSIVEFCEMFEAIVNSTNGADKILLQSAPVDTGLRYIPTKLCAYYSSMLNHCVGIFGKDYEDKYAFSVYPSLKSGSEAHVMFHKVIDHGKVCIIQIPEQAIAHISHVRQVLFHELFHILPGGVRKRRLRADMFGRILIMGLLYRFESNWQEQNTNKKTILQEKLFAALAQNNVDYIKQLPNNSNEDPQNVYSEDVQRHFANAAVNCVVKLQGLTFDELSNFFDEDKECEEYVKYKKLHEENIKLWEKIINISHVIINNHEIMYMSDFYMTLFREPLSDLLAVLMLRLSPDLYYRQLVQSWGSKQNKVEIENIDILYFRAYFVTDVLQSEEIQLELRKKDSEFANMWVHADHVMAPIIEKVQKVDTSLECTQDFARMLWMGDEIQSMYQRYFAECCKVFLALMNEHRQEFDSFRAHYALDEIDEEKLILYIGNRQWE